MAETANVHYRPLTPQDEACLWEMLYLALYVPPGAPPLPREVVHQPEISRYVENWGKPNDMGYVVIDGGIQQAVGAVWIRLLTGDQRGYGYVDKATPELSIALLPSYRGQGIGTQLMARMLAAARLAHPAVSLSVSVDNPARRLYQRMGFEVVGKEGASLTMLCRFTRAPSA